MAGAVDDQPLFQVREHPFQFVDPLGADQAGDHGIMGSGDEQRRLMDLRALPGRGQFPVAVDIAVPVQPAAKTGFLVGFGKRCDVGLGDPVRQRQIRPQLAQESLAFFDEHGRGVGNATPQHHPHGLRDIALELGLGDAGRLKILPVEVGDPALAQGVERPVTAAKGRGNAEPRDPGEDVRTEHGRVPGDRRAPIMADDDGLFLAKRRHEGDHVADGVEDGVGADVTRRAALPIAAHVGRHDMETGVGQGRDLVPPGIGQFGPAVAEQHKWTFALFAHEQIDAVGGNGA